MQDRWDFLKFAREVDAHAFARSNSVQRANLMEKKMIIRPDSNLFNFEVKIINNE